MWEEPEDFVASFASTSTSTWVPPTSYGIFDIYNSTKFLTAEWDVTTSPVSMFTIQLLYSIWNVIFRVGELR